MHSEHARNNLPMNGAGKGERRLRVLIWACTSQEASDVVRSFNRAETVHVPSDNVPELDSELNEHHPDYVLCRADFLIDLIANHRAVKAAASVNMIRPALLRESDISPRDTEVLQLIAKGARNSDIAQVLDVAESSVKRILQSLYERFEVANRAELLGRIIELQAESRLLLDTPPGLSK